MIYAILIVVLFVIMLLYLKVADHYNIIDKPNERSSHNEVTIRGGGIIFLFSAIFMFGLHPDFWMPVLGMIVIGVVSFIDDRITLSNKIRLFFHLTAVTLLFLAVDLFHIYAWYYVVIYYIIAIGIINAYNFMDGINGITGVYTLIIFGGLQYVNYNVIPFFDPDMIWLPMLACCTFLFFNFRKKAKCFAGDVGSISIAFWIIFLLLKLIIKSENYIYILFLSVYGVDTVLTIIHRMLLKQNIFKAHRLHFYQILANDQKWPHLWVAVTYGLMQALIILLVVSASFSSILTIIISLLPLLALYIGLKKRLMTINYPETIDK